MARDVSGAILIGGALRRDEYSFFDAFLELPLTQRVTTEFGYGISRNFSNDEFYNYDSDKVYLWIWLSNFKREIFCAQLVNM